MSHRNLAYARHAFNNGSAKILPISPEWLYTLLLVSLLFSVIVLIPIWRGEQTFATKILLSLIGLFPIFGGILILWIIRFYPINPPNVQNKTKKSHPKPKK